MIISICSYQVKRAAPKTDIERPHAAFRAVREHETNESGQRPDRTVQVKQATMFRRCVTGGGSERSSVLFVARNCSRSTWLRFGSGD